MTIASATRRAWRIFAADVRAVRELSPSFVRVTFAGPDLVDLADTGPDLRIKLVVPLPELGTRWFPTDSGQWYADWQRLPDEHRNPIRTYTLRAVRPHSREVDVDVVRHVGGAATGWLLGPTPASSLLIGPDARYDGDAGGVEWRPPPAGAPLLVAGDETAVPAIARICASLASDAVGAVVLEVPDPGDVLDLSAPPGVHVHWLARGAHTPGTHLVDMVTAVAGDLVGTSPAATAPEPTDLDPDDPLLWEVPAERPEGAYAWVAGEAGAVRRIRRHLVRNLGVPRSAVACMGYWRLGVTGA